MALLMNIFQRKQEAKILTLRLVEVNEEDDGLGALGNRTRARQYDGYRRTADVSRTQYGELRRRFPTRRSTAMSG